MHPNSGRGWYCLRIGTVGNDLFCHFARVEIIAKPIAFIGPLARVGILEKLNRTIPLRIQSSAAEYNAHGFRAIPILPGEQLASQAQSSR